MKTCYVSLDDFVNKKQRKRLAKRKRRHALTQQGNGGYFYASIENPLRGLSDSEVNEFIRQVAQHHGSTFEIAFEGLREAAAQTDPLTVLSIFAAYCLTSFDGTSREWDESPPLLQPHIELLQATYLLNQPESDRRPANPGDLGILDEHLRDVGSSFFMRRIGVLEGATFEEKARAFLIEDMRGQTQAIRNWGYASQVRRVVTEVFESLEEDIESARGVRIDHIFEMHERFEDEAMSRLSNHFEAMAAVWRATTVEAAAAAYSKAQALSTSDAAKILDVLMDDKTDLETAKAMLISHFDLRLFECYTYSLDEWTKFYPVPIERDVLAQFLDGWSLGFGDLKEVDPEHLFLGNPIWARPLIKSGDESYF